MSEEKKKGSRKREQNEENENYGYDAEQATASRRKRSAANEEAGAERKSNKRQEERRALKGEKPRNPDSVGNQLAVILLVVVALFTAICLLIPSIVGAVGGAIGKVLFGVFGNGAYLVPPLLVQLALFWRRDVKSGAVCYKYIISIAFLLFFSVLMHAFYQIAQPEEITGELLQWRNLGALYENGKMNRGGGFLGGLVALCLIFSVGYAGTFICTILFLATFGMTLVGLTPAECWARFRFYYRRNKAARLAKRSEAEKKRSEEDARKKAEAASRSTDIVPARGSGIDPAVFEKDAGLGREENGTIYPLHVVSDDNVKLEDIFDQKEDKEVEDRYTKDRERWNETQAQTDIPVGGEEKKKTPSGKSKTEQKTEAKQISLPEQKDEPKPYVFPPITLLQEEPANKATDVSAELRDNAERIIQTLDSFHVHVTISNVSRGPTVTRYELEPSAGTRVRSITNLLDDIALSLASSGVRCDGIIAGKSAIGIEVPNKSVKTVYVRGLIENPQFKEAKSRLTTSLGQDVSGSPVYLDIAKMPHLLIAGATGMGKSVCINSLLVSLLYKARPDEVKLILIDPKKVELNIYNNIPHLLVPVVFEPKKAAGALHWAVTEMERRFEMIEAQNTRNISQYNAAIAGDPNKEKMTQIVIIIDELADLMMSAPDDVESSICRLAQKARAAGMHLIIGTQRPSVDVITGLIKANIPSRIAFTVASQIDSRTIIDMQGAEKLIGRGDMLYAPVGASKPIRVQGSFVSEKEIEEVVAFIKDNSKDCKYSGDVIDEIDRASELCGQKKGKAPAVVADEGGDGEEVDPMLDEAIELAVDSGKISTSLIQRRLSLGYGRAAKLVDIMEKRGIVSKPDGQKPRTVLLTREQYLEMKVNGVSAAASAEEAEEDDGGDEAPF